MRNFAEHPDEEAPGHTIGKVTKQGAIITIFALILAFLATALFSGCAVSRLDASVTSGHSGDITGTVGITFREFQGSDDDILAIVNTNREVVFRQGLQAIGKQGERAAVFGNNYPGTDAELHQCVNDAVKNIIGLVRVYGFDPHNIVLYVNDECTAASYKASANWLLTDKTAPPGRRFFGNSSHGAQDADNTGILRDVIVTWDMVKTGRWDETTEVPWELWHDSIRQAPEGVSFVVLNDCCHAGGIMKLIGPAPLPTAGTPQRLVRSLEGPAEVQKRVAEARKRHTRALTTTNAQIKRGTVFAVCRSDQLASEGETGGAGTDAFWASARSMPDKYSILPIIKASNAHMAQRGFKQNMNPVGRLDTLWPK
jgi:hypothetical protein